MQASARGSPTTQQTQTNAHGTVPSTTLASPQDYDLRGRMIAFAWRQLKCAPSVESSNKRKDFAVSFQNCRQLPCCETLSHKRENTVTPQLRIGVRGSPIAQRRRRGGRSVVSRCAIFHFSHSFIFSLFPYFIFPFFSFSIFFNFSIFHFSSFFIVHGLFFFSFYKFLLFFCFFLFFVFFMFVIFPPPRGSRAPLLPKTPLFSNKNLNFKA